VGVDRFGSVLSFMERLQVLDEAEHCKLIRELRNAVNHEYEDDGTRLGEFFASLAKETPVRVATPPQRWPKFNARSSCPQTRRQPLN
jgi:hypothetical protein